MNEYQVTQNYQSRFKEDWIVLHQGETVKLDDDVAVFVNVDSPGTLELVAQIQSRMEDAPSLDRMLKRAPKKRDDTSPAQPIDKTTFKAVKDKDA